MLSHKKVVKALLLTRLPTLYAAKTLRKKKMLSYTKQYKFWAFSELHHHCYLSPH